MRLNRKLAGSISAIALFAATSAYAAGMFSGWPFAGGTQYPSTLPLTGNEGVAADTQLPSGLNPASELISVDSLVQGSSVSNNVSGNATLTVTQMVGGARLTLLLTDAISGATTLTTPTAAAIVAALPTQSQVVGKSWLWKIVNQAGTGSGVWTISGGSNVTITGNATVAVASSRTFLVKVTAVSTPAVTLTDWGN